MGSALTISHTHWCPVLEVGDRSLADNPESWSFFFCTSMKGGQASSCEAASAFSTSLSVRYFYLVIQLTLFVTFPPTVSSACHAPALDEAGPFITPTASAPPALAAVLMKGAASCPLRRETGRARRGQPEPVSPLCNYPSGKQRVRGTLCTGLENPGSTSAFYFFC